MYLNNDFKLVKRDKYIIWSIIGFTFICMIVLFAVTTAHFKYDNAISEEFFKGMKYDIFRGWVTYFINDANLLIVSIIAPVVFVLIESLYAFKKRYSPKSYGARHFYEKKWIYFTFYIVYPIISILVLGEIFFKDQGFGHGYYTFGIAGLRYTIPCYIVSVILNLAVFYALMYYVRFDLAKRKDFLESNIWKRAFVNILFIIFIYVVVLILKSGFERPYWYNLHWHKYSDMIKADNPKAYDKYINQSAKNWGWGTQANGNASISDFPTNLQDWPWYRVAHGFFAPHNPYYKNSPWSDAFPSGHMGMSSIILCALWYVLFAESNTKTRRILRYTMWAVGILYITNLFFVMLVSLGHWAADLSFTLIWAPIAFICCHYIVDGICRTTWKHSERLKMLVM